MDDHQLSALEGRQFGGYQILSLLGAGGMGEVYRARDLKLGREVALKVIVRSAAADPGYLQRFEDEARLASGINHPNIVTIYGVGDEDGLAYIAMELVRGRTLREVQAAGLSIGAVLDLAAPLAEALAAAHASGVMHRDLKPENVMVTTDGQVKVLDFGLAKRPRGIEWEDDGGATRAPMTQAGTIIGTVGYMSPEQAAGRPGGFASDQFSFGVILYELLCGRRPFQGETAVETLSSIIRDDPPALRSINPAAAPEIEAVVHRCLAKQPGDRYAETRQLAAELRELRAWWNRERGVPSGAPVSHPTSAPTVLHGIPTVSPMTRRRALWLTGGAAIAAAAGVATWRTWSADTGIRVVAVLPFANAGNDEAAEYLCDGITESLIQQIGRVPSLTVMARSTVFNFKGKTVDPRETGRQLGVDAILTGTVTARAGQLRITAELVHVASGARLWGNTYERTAAAMVSIQDDIAKAIVDEGIRLRLSGDERRSLAQHPTDDPEAYEAYLRGRHALVAGTEEGLLQAREFLTRATTRDPGFALAFATLAGTYVEAAVDGFERPTDAFPMANRHTRQALDLEPDLAEAHACAAESAFFFEWDWVNADRAWTRAEQSARRGPALTQEILGHALSRWALGRPDEALRLVRRIRLADPLTVAYAVLEADYLFHSGQIEAAEGLYERTLSESPTAAAYFGLAEVRRVQGRFDDAIEARRRAHEAIGDDSLDAVFAAAQGEAGYRSVERAAARLELDALGQRAPDNYASPLDFARALAQLGETEQSFRHLDAAFADRAPGLVFLKVDRAWDGVRGDDRFAAAVRRVGLP